MKNDEFKEIGQAAQGLFYPSESDEPLEPVCWGPDLEEALAQAANGRDVTEQAADDFFAALEGSDEEERWTELQLVIDRRLRNIRVFRIGQRRVDVYLLGQDRAGEWVGLHTVSIET